MPQQLQSNLKHEVMVQERLSFLIASCMFA